MNFAQKHIEHCQSWFLRTLLSLGLWEESFTCHSCSCTFFSGEYQPQICAAATKAQWVVKELVPRRNNKKPSTTVLRRAPLASPYGWQIHPLERGRNQIQKWKPPNELPCCLWSVDEAQIARTRSLRQPP